MNRACHPTIVLPAAKCANAHHNPQLDKSGATASSPPHRNLIFDVYDLLYRDQLGIFPTNWTAPNLP
jgi:hypothetical protein